MNFSTILERTPNHPKSEKVRKDLRLSIWAIERKAVCLHYIGHHSPIRQNQLNEIEGQDLGPYHWERGHAKLIKNYEEYKTYVTFSLFVVRVWAASPPLGFCCIPETIDPSASV